MSVEPPDRYVCPLGLDLMEDPVMCKEGHNFDRQNIKEWLQKNEECPIDRESLKLDQLYPNRALKEEIQEWKARHSAIATSSPPVAAAAAAAAPPQYFMQLEPQPPLPVPPMVAAEPPLPSARGEEQTPWKRFGMAQSEYDHLYSTFISYDYEDVGRLNRKYAQKLCRFMNYPHSDWEIDAMFHQLGKANTEAVGFEEFAEYVKDKRPEPEEMYGICSSEYHEILARFMEADVDRDGNLSCKELQSLCKKTDQPVTDEIVQDMYKQMDVERTGLLNVDQFLRYMQAYRLSGGRPVTDVTRVKHQSQSQNQNQNRHSAPTSPIQPPPLPHSPSYVPPIPVAPQHYHAPPTPPVAQRNSLGGSSPHSGNTPRNSQTPHTSYSPPQRANSYSVAPSKVNSQQHRTSFTGIAPAASAPAAPAASTPTSARTPATSGSSSGKKKKLFGLF